MEGTMAAEILCPKCGFEMLPWRYTGGWRSFSCRSCFFVKIEAVEEKMAEKPEPVFAKIESVEEGPEQVACNSGTTPKSR
jgi:hypothetical protein